MLVRYTLPEASIAQLAEQSLRKRKVSGSIPLRGSFYDNFFTILKTKELQPNCSIVKPGYFLPGIRSAKL